MRDPYEILGVSRNASMDEIKKAYRTLSRKYHPDANINNPLADLAAEKFKEVQEAYSTIVKERENPSSSYHSYQSSSSRSQSTQSTSTYTGNNDYSTVYGYLRLRRYREALNLLADMPKDAHWYFLSAFANAGIGNNWLALTHAQQAVRMEPGNAEYRNLLHQLQNGFTRYNTMGEGYGRSYSTNTSCCDTCCILYEASLCCGC